MTSDQPEEVVIAELIREKVLWHTRDEVPHSVGATVDDLRYDEENDTTTVHATVFVERESQQGIVVGSGGSMVKRIGTEARKDLEVLFGTKVYLDLAVRVKKDWRSDGAMIKRFGYGEGL
jgi:GTP-binding protein Era